MVIYTSSKNAKSDNSTGQDNASSSIRPLSIEGPRSQDHNQAPAQPMSNRPRQPANLQGLLRFALEATKTEDAPHESRFQPLDEEVNNYSQSMYNTKSIESLPQHISNVLKYILSILVLIILSSEKSF